MTEMVVAGTPVEHHPSYRLWVKREDLSCPPPGPPFSKARGVWSHLQGREEQVIGVLDTYHSQAGWAVARACQLLGKRCVNFYPEYKGEPGWREPQERAAALGAELHGLLAGRSSVIYHMARRAMASTYGQDEPWYMMPNALKLPESVAETAEEAARTDLGCLSENVRVVIVPASSATIAAGVVAGLYLAVTMGKAPVLPVVVHLGYSRSEDQVRRYVRSCVMMYLGVDEPNALLREMLRSVIVVDEGHAYKDRADLVGAPPWPCNPYYDLKSLAWWLRVRDSYEGDALLWNVG